MRRAPAHGCAPMANPHKALTAPTNHASCTHRTGGCFCMDLFALQWVVLGKCGAALIHRVGSSGKEGGFFWERGWVLLGKSHLANRLKNKAFLAFSRSLIPIHIYI